MLLTIKGMARATYYYNIRERIDKYADLRKEIARIFDKNKGRYGYRRIYLQLREEGHSVNHKTVAKLMNEMGLYARKPKLRYHSYKGEVQMSRRWIYVVRNATCRLYWTCGMAR